MFSSTVMQQVVHTHVTLFTKPYKLVPARDRDDLNSGKVTVGMTESNVSSVND